MLENGFNPNVATFTTVINSFSKKDVMDQFCKVGKKDEAMELLNEALEIGLTPNVVACNALFNGYCKVGRSLEGINLLKQMKDSNCMPDYISYSTLLHGIEMGTNSLRITCL